MCVSENLTGLSVLIVGEKPRNGEQDGDAFPAMTGEYGYKAKNSDQSEAA
ncbi:MAG: hypothetical protein ABI197_05570 [Granulicella sp.]